MHGPGGRAPIPPATPLALNPPGMDGATLRSQDGRKSPRRNVLRKDGSAAADAPAEVPEVAWSRPLRNPGRAPDTAPAGMAWPGVEPLPDPPVLPAEVVAPLPELAAVPPTDQAQQPTTGQALEEPPAGAGVVTTNDSEDAATAGPARDAHARTGAPSEADQLETLIQSAKQRLSGVRSYQSRMVRQERVGEKLLPPEEVLLSVRRAPFAVRLEWPSGPNQGREVIFAGAESDGKIQIKQPGSMIPRLTLSPDSPLVARSSRHPISEAGFDALVSNLEKSLNEMRAGQTSLSLEEPSVVPEVGRRCYRVLETRPDGERWVVCIDAETLIPTIVEGHDAERGLLERYLFHDVRFNPAELASADAFDADRRWAASASPGLLGRLARTAGAALDGGSGDSVLPR